jgi:hypothetical protein
MSSSNTDTLGVELDMTGGAEAKTLLAVGDTTELTVPNMLSEDAAKLEPETEGNIAGELPSKSSIPRRSTEGA